MKRGTLLNETSGELSALHFELRDSRPNKLQPLAVATLCRDVTDDCAWHCRKEKKKHTAFFFFSYFSFLLGYNRYHIYRTCESNIHLQLHLAVPSHASGDVFPSVNKKKTRTFLLINQTRGVQPIQEVLQGHRRLLFNYVLG